MERWRRVQNRSRPSLQYGKQKKEWPGCKINDFSTRSKTLALVLFFSNLTVTVCSRDWDETVFEAPNTLLKRLINQKSVSKLLRILILFFLNSLLDRFIVHLG